MRYKYLTNASSKASLYASLKIIRLIRDDKSSLFNVRAYAL